MQFKLWQVAFGDLLILNKVDLVPRAEITRITDWLDDHLHRYRLIEAVRSDIPLEVLLGVGRFDPARLGGTSSHDASSSGTANSPEYPNGEHGHGGNHQDDFETWSYETFEPVSLDALRKAAANLPVGIYRAKGVIFAADQPERRSVLQVVGKRADISLDQLWGSRVPAPRSSPSARQGRSTPKSSTTTLTRAWSTANPAAIDSLKGTRHVRQL